MADEFQYIKLPDGTYGKFAANAQDADIQAQIAKDFPQTLGPQPGNAFTSPQGFLPTVRANFDDALRPSNASDGGVVSQVAHDFGRGAAATLAAPLVHPVDAATGLAHAVAHPYDTAKAVVGSTVQDFRDNGALKAIPNLFGQAAGTLIGGELGSAAGKVAAVPLRSAAEGTFEGALNIGKIDRAYGKTPGSAGLDFTTGVRPDTIARSAQDAIRNRGSAINAMADAHPSPVDISPAVTSVEDDIALAC